LIGRNCRNLLPTCVEDDFRAFSEIPVRNAKTSRLGRIIFAGSKTQEV